jgi:hypothetical protein
MKKTWWIKNTNGKPDAMLTFAFFSFLVVTLNVFLSTFGMVQIGDFALQFEALDSSVMAIYLGATFTAYVSRRFTDTKFLPDGGRGPAQPVPEPNPEIMGSENSSTMGGR